MFGRGFRVFNPGSKRGAMVPSPIILATAGVRIGTVVFDTADINAGLTPKAIDAFPGVPGFYWMPIAWSSDKDIAVVHVPTNATFNLRWSGGSAANLMNGITPRVTTFGSRVDTGVDASANETPNTDAIGKGLVVVASANNGGGGAGNYVRFTVAACLCRSGA